MIPGLLGNRKTFTAGFRNPIEKRGDRARQQLTTRWGYPRAEVRYLPESAIADVPKIVAGLRAGKPYAAVPIVSPCRLRR